MVRNQGNRRMMEVSVQQTPAMNHSAAKQISPDQQSKMPT
jgi:hypothetical protein